MLKNKLFKRVVKILILMFVFIGPNLVCAKGLDHNLDKSFIQKEYEESYQVLLAALFSEASYHKFEESIAKQYLSDYGWKEETFKVVNEKPKLIASLDLCTKEGQKNKNFIVLAIKGTSSVNDWRRDFLLGSERFDIYNETANYKQRVRAKEFILNGEVRHTYLEYLKALVTIKKDNELMLDYLVRDLKTHPDKFLIVTGHSAGGAIATIYAELLAGRGISKDQMKVITFGAPSVGNNVMIKYLGAKIDLLRVVNNDDAFTGFLAGVLGRFEQFGRKKNYNVDPVYEDLQHPIAVYIDYVFKDYEKQKARAIEANVIEPENSKVDLSFPKVAIIAKDASKVKLDPEMPDFVNLAQVEISKIFPNYRVVNSFTEAKESDADYILLIENGICPLGKDDQVMLTTQKLYNKNGVNLELGMHATKMKIRRRIIGSSLYNIKRCKEDLRKLYPKLVFPKEIIEFKERVY